MKEKTVIQNIYGTVHGHVAAGDMTMGPGAVQAPSPKRLRAVLWEARLHKFNAHLGRYINAPAVCILAAMAFYGPRAFDLVRSLMQGPQQVNVDMAWTELAVGAALMLLLTLWLKQARHGYGLTIQHAQQKIDQAKLALRHLPK